jgi:hypothetical protein
VFGEKEFNLVVRPIHPPSRRHQSPFTIASDPCDGITAVGRGVLLSDEGASWIAVVRYVKKDVARRRAVTQRSVSACRHPSRCSKWLYRDQGGRRTMLQFVTYTQELRY